MEWRIEGGRLPAYRYERGHLSRRHRRGRRRRGQIGPLFSQASGTVPASAGGGGGFPTMPIKAVLVGVTQ